MDITESKQQLVTFLESIQQNPFSKGTHGTPTIELRKFFRRLAFYKDTFDGRTVIDSNKLIKSMTPSFQRDNTKWSEEMQAAFIENIICGLRTELMLYFVEAEDSGNSFILDGLQRITAIEAFLNNKLPVYNNMYFDDIDKLSGFRLSRADLTLKIYKFKTHREACNHYIGMNKFITHSPEDLESAYAFLQAGK